MCNVCLIMKFLGECVFLYSYPTPVPVLYFCSSLLCTRIYPVLVIWYKVMWNFSILHFADVCSFSCMYVLYWNVGFFLVSSWIELNFFVFYESKTGLYLGYRTSQEIYYIHNSCKVSKLQKRVIRIMSGSEPTAPCRVLFRKLELLPVQCHYTLSLMLFILDNPNNFQTGLEIHGLHTRS
jgi:hypothetical protein